MYDTYINIRYNIIYNNLLFTDDNVHACNATIRIICIYNVRHYRVYDVLLELEI